MRLGPHLELAQHPFRKGETYNQQLGDTARKKIGKRSWNKRIDRAITTWRTLFTFDHLYIGGGNTRHVTLTLPPDVTLIDPNAGLLGALRLWQPERRLGSEVSRDRAPVLRSEGTS